MSTEFSAALNDLIQFFSRLPGGVNLKTGYVTRYRSGVLLPKARVEAVADFLAQDGQVESAAELREEYDRLNEALFPGRLVGVAPRTPQDRQKHLEAAVKRIVAILEKVKATGGDDEGPEPPPPPPRTPVYQSKCVKLFGPGEQPEVCGKPKPKLTAARYDAVQALIEAGDDGLTKDQLDKKSGHTDARKLLRRLAKKDRDWKKMLLFPETPGKRYRIR